MDLRSVFITNLKKYRKQRKMSQMKLAEYCSTSTGYIGEIEIGKKFPSIEMIQKIAAVLEIEPYKLFVSEEDNSVHAISSAAKRELLKKLDELIETVKKCDMWGGG